MEYNKIKTLLLIFIIASFLFVSCWNENKKKGFYDYSRVSYIYRLPIVEPYVISSPDNGANWIIELKTDSPSTHGAQFLTKVGVRDSIFVVYSPKDLSKPGHPQEWVVVDVSNREEKIFTNESDYKTYLGQKRAEAINLRNINDVFSNFDKSKKLPPEWTQNK